MIRQLMYNNNFILLNNSKMLSKMPVNIKKKQKQIYKRLLHIWEGGWVMLHFHVISATNSRVNEHSVLLHSETHSASDYIC